MLLMPEAHFTKAACTGQAGVVLVTVTVADATGTFQQGALHSTGRQGAGNSRS